MGGIVGRCRTDESVHFTAVCDEDHVNAHLIRVSIPYSSVCVGAFKLPFVDLSYRLGWLAFCLRAKAKGSLGFAKC